MNKSQFIFFCGPGATTQLTAFTSFQLNSNVALVRTMLLVKPCFGKPCDLFKPRSFLPEDLKTSWREEGGLLLISQSVRDFLTSALVGWTYFLPRSSIEEPLEYPNLRRSSFFLPVLLRIYKVCPGSNCLLIGL